MNSKFFRPNHSEQSRLKAPLFVQARIAFYGLDHLPQQCLMLIMDDVCVALSEHGELSGAIQRLVFPCTVTSTDRRLLYVAVTVEISKRPASLAHSSQIPKTPWPSTIACPAYASCCIQPLVHYHALLAGAEAAAIALVHTALTLRWVVLVGELPQLGVFRRPWWVHQSSC